MADVSRTRQTPAYSALAIVGSTLSGVGLAKVIAGIDLLPMRWKFEQYRWYLVGVGFLLGLPHAAGLVRQVKSSGSSADR